MKIIFLDIDGVLNSELHVHEMGEAWDGNQIDPKTVIRLNKITDATNARIVVSSSWRVCHSLEELRFILKAAGISAEIIGVTPILRSDRANEIWEWLDNNKDIDNYVILDDDRLERKRDSSDPILDLHFVRTSWYDGLQDRHIEKVIGILNGCIFC